MALKSNQSGFNLSLCQGWPMLLRENVLTPLRPSVSFFLSFSFFFFLFSVSFYRKRGKYSSHKEVVKIRWDQAYRAPSRCSIHDRYPLLIFIHFSWLQLSQQSWLDSETAPLAPGGILALGLVTWSSLASCSLRGTNFTLPDRSTLQIVFVLK